MIPLKAVLVGVLECSCFDTMLISRKAPVCAWQNLALNRLGFTEKYNELSGA